MSGQPVVQFENFSFRYKTRKEPTLIGINLTIYEGEKVLIIGSSGSGKSTLANCINGLIPFSYNGTIEGVCKVNGTETKTRSVFRLAREVGTVLQDSDAQFVGLSVGEDAAFAMENAMVPRPAMMARVLENCAAVGMENFLAALPFYLSGGQKQKASLAGVLDEETRILIFDEPLAALDPQSGMSAIDLIDRIAKNHTVIIIEHRLEDVLYRPCDRIIVMHEGRIACDLSPEELLRTTLLREYGIREPLYITAMKYARCDFENARALADIHTLELSGENRQKLQTFFNADTPPAPRSGGREIIRLNEVSFAYEGAAGGVRHPDGVRHHGPPPALENVSFSIRQGERVAVIGKNGAGKSTLARLLCGISRPGSGTITIDGKDSAALSVKEIGERIGYVMQDPNQMLVKDIIKDEVELALRLHGYPEAECASRSRRALEACGLYRMRNWPVDAVSYGQKKRVTIASVLALEPDIIILDEPTAGQDYRHYMEIIGFIDTLNTVYGKTIIFITHDIHLAIEQTDRALVFADGSLIANDTVFRVLADKDIVERASLKPTSLYALAEKLDVSGERCIERYINYERERASAGKTAGTGVAG